MSVHVSEMAQSGNFLEYTLATGRWMTPSNVFGTVRQTRLGSFASAASLR